MSYRVKFIKETDIKKEKTILDVAEDIKVKIKASCDGKGKCGKCVVKIMEGKVSEPTKAETKFLGKEKLEKGYRLACETEVLGDVIVSLSE